MENSTDNKIDNKINTARDGVTQIGKDLRADAHATIDRIADKVPPATDLLATQAHNGVDSVADGVQSASERLAARGKQAVETCKNITESSRTRVRANPMVSVLVAAAAGYGISKLLGSRSNK
jgi:ElaB protein